jgi:hypothetical protein
VIKINEIGETRNRVWKMLIYNLDRMKGIPRSIFLRLCARIILKWLLQRERMRFCCGFNPLRT